MYGLSNFSFSSQWSPVIFLLLAAITVLYLYLCGPGRARFADAEPVSRLKKFWFIGGMVILYAAIGSPIDLMGHYMFTFHMLSMAMAYIIAAPMLLAGIPGWMLRPIGKIPGARKLKFLLNPVVSLVLFNLAFSVYHFPPVHDYVMTNYVVHVIYYTVLLFASMLMCFPIICPVPELDRLQGVNKMFYIFGNSLLLMPACALIIFSNSPMYATYTDPELWAIAMGFCIPQGATVVLDMFTGPQNLAWFDPLEDQRIGGIVMKMIQETVYGGTLIYVFRQWYRRENPKSNEEHNPYEPTQAYYDQLSTPSEPVK